MSLLSKSYRSVLQQPVRSAMSTTIEPESESEFALQLKSAVYLMVAKMVEENLAQIDKEVTATPTFIASLVELVYNQLVNLGEDLELFANHAGRYIVRPADMYMVTRKNDILTQALKDLEDQLRSEK